MAHFAVYVLFRSYSYSLWDVISLKQFLNANIVISSVDFLSPRVLNDGVLYQQSCAVISGSDNNSLMRAKLQFECDLCCSSEDAIRFCKSWSEHEVLLMHFSLPSLYQPLMRKLNYNIVVTYRYYTTSSKYFHSSTSYEHNRNLKQLGNYTPLTKVLHTCLLVKLTLYQHIMLRVEYRHRLSLITSIASVRERTNKNFLKISLRLNIHIAVLRIASLLTYVNTGQLMCFATAHSFVDNSISEQCVPLTQAQFTSDILRGGGMPHVVSPEIVRPFIIQNDRYMLFNPNVQYKFVQYSLNEPSLISSVDEKTVILARLPLSICCQWMSVTELMSVSKLHGITHLTVKTMRRQLLDMIQEHFCSTCTCHACAFEEVKISHETKKKEKSDGVSGKRSIHFVCPDLLRS